ncbi:MAG: glycosyltransferase family 39 protein [Ginsengibacter sp.]
MKFTIRPIYFILFCLLLNLVQAALTELTSDEGYYWFYSQNLEWGYYDHPPFLALIVKIGYYFLHNELGVRLLNVVLTSAGLLLVLNLMPWKLLQKTHTYILLLSLPLLHYLSFIIFPDGPLLFFSAVYLWSYRKFIEKKDIGSSVIMGVAITLMLYSKYHGILIVLFTLLSNLKLLRNKYFYFSVLLSFVLFVPHLWWQYRHDFITFDYHLRKRTEGFSSRHILEYISQQILAIGPGFIFIPFVYKTKNQFEKTLVYIILGTLFFFLFTSLKGFVHFHWTSLIIFPLILLAVKYYDDNKKMKLFYWLMLPFLFIIFLFRIQMMFRVLPVNHVNVDYYHGRKLWAKDITSIAHSDPVLFGNQFRESSLYSFYSGQMGVALFSGEDRRSQYEIWNYEDSLQGKNVLYISKYPFPECTTLPTRMGKTLYYYKLPCFHSFYNIPIHSNFPGIINKLTETDINLSIINSRKKTLFFKCKNSQEDVVLFYTIKKGNNLIMEQEIKTFSSTDSIPVNGKLDLRVKILTTQLTEGKYDLSFGFKSHIIEDSYNAIHGFMVR